jgi:hypothetical protein
MKDLKTFRRTWSADHKRLRGYLSSGDQLQSAKDLFFTLHGVLHSGDLIGADLWSYADHIFSDLTDDQYRRIPENTDHSLIWILWHISRIEDITMNILVKNESQVYLSGGWVDKMNSPIHHAGNLIQEENLRLISQKIETEQLFKYRIAVGRRTQEIVQNLSTEELSQKTQPDRLARIMEEGTVLPEAEVLIEYWSRKKIYQLLLMPPTRHLMVHLNEALAFKEVMTKST